ncbi:unnamed protein product [Somion occarium]|uniref:Uncharacterized protein n=1 Tax=Somion occarium TaxID=3059160 RepID=A0ABP1EB38_9APHY
MNYVTSPQFPDTISQFLQEASHLCANTELFTLLGETMHRLTWIQLDALLLCMPSLQCFILANFVFLGSADGDSDTRSCHVHPSVHNVRLYTLNASSAQTIYDLFCLLPNVQSFMTFSLTIINHDSPLDTYPPHLALNSLTIYLSDTRLIAGLKHVSTTHPLTTLDVAYINKPDMMATMWNLDPLIKRNLKSFRIGFRTIFDQTEDLVVLRSQEINPWDGIDFSSFTSLSSIAIIIPVGPDMGCDIRAFDFVPATVRYVRVELYLNDGGGSEDTVLNPGSDVWEPLDRLQSRCPQLEWVTLQQRYLDPNHSDGRLGYNEWTPWSEEASLVLRERIPTLAARRMLWGLFAGPSPN